MKVERYYLEINSIRDLKKSASPDHNLILEKIKKHDFELNKFFYKNVGKKHRWVDRLSWDNLKWISYLENENVHTYILKLKNELVGFFELIQDKSTQSTEIAYFGILEEYIGKKYGSYLLSEAISECFNLNSKRVWLHTCTLDHENALKNYLSRGMKIFKQENINLVLN